MKYFKASLKGHDVLPVTTSNFICTAQAVENNQWSLQLALFVFARTSSLSLFVMIHVLFLGVTSASRKTRRMEGLLGSS